ncbi:MAG: NAD(P)/FAD-dependent oxidoreductase [Gammaproteobacteria bacterium]|jgi:phytoene dehydrogenase-like protein|nr:NAD(P)/FAD-dependent oxidoreductase [Gammaproteobacteria bacterium]
MSNSNYEVVIVGGGHNGLACAALLTKFGVKTLVVERNEWVGGGVLTREVTLPGFKHDLYGSSHVWIHINPTFKNELQPELEKHGLKYIWADDHITGHPNLEGQGIIVYKDVDKTCDSIAEYSKKDAQRYREIYEEFEEVRAGVVRAMFSPPAPPSYTFQALENNSEGLRRLRDYQLSSRAFTLKNFENPHVRAFILGWAMAPQTLPDQEATAQGFYVMIPSIHYFGESIPEGGSGMLCEAMKNYIEANGGKVMTGVTVDKFIIENNKCRGVRLADNTDILATRAVVSGLDPQQTFLRCMEEHEVDPRIRSIVEHFSFGNVTIARAHYAIHEPPEFNNGPDMSATPFQRIFGSIDDIDKQYNEIAAGLAPSDPFLWSACWTKKDPTRAPDDKHTFIFDTFVPVDLASGEDWEEIGPKYVRDILLRNLRRHTSNMADDNIMAEYIDTGPQLARDNWSFVRGTTTGGERVLSQLGAFRPIPGFAEYRSPVVNLYMTGPSCHPGGGISAMGTNTANAMLEDFGLKEPQDSF